MTQRRQRLMPFHDPFRTTARQHLISFIPTAIPVSTSCSRRKQPDQAHQAGTSRRLRFLDGKMEPPEAYLNLQNGQTNGPYTAYILYFGMLGHYLGSFGGPGTSEIMFAQGAETKLRCPGGPAHPLPPTFLRDDSEATRPGATQGPQP